YTRSPPTTFFFNEPAPPELYTLSLHDALPIFRDLAEAALRGEPDHGADRLGHAREQADVHYVLGQLVAHLGRDQAGVNAVHPDRSEEHTSELQSRSDLVCRLLLEKKKKIKHKP